MTALRRYDDTFVTVAFFVAATLEHARRRCPGKAAKRDVRRPNTLARLAKVAFATFRNPAWRRLRAGRSRPARAGRRDVYTLVSVAPLLDRARCVPLGMPAMMAAP
jgi:hypothetical protein